MAAKGISKAVAGAIEPFEKIGSQVGNLAKSLPKYTPLPIPGGSLAGAQRAATDLAHLPEAAANKRYENSAVGKLLKADLIMPADEVKKLRDAIAGGSKTEIERIMKAYGGRSNNHMTDAPDAMWDEIKKKGETYKKLDFRQKKQFDNFAIEYPNGPKTDEQKKALMSIMNSVFGASASSNAGSNGASGIKTNTENGVTKSITINNN